MKRPEPKPRWMKLTVGLAKGLALCGIGAVLSLPSLTARAEDQYYINDAIVTYPGTELALPVINATNFINTSIFSVNFTDGDTPYITLFETWDTLTYTNTGTLQANTGFQFDTLSTVSGLHSRAASFFNPGEIYCASLQDTTDPYGGGLALENYAQCWVNATNILSPGLIQTGERGLVQLAGQNINLARGRVTVEGGPVNLLGNAVIGFNTNFWDPSIDLTANSALSSPPIDLYLPNSTPYFDIQSPGQGGTNVVRAVFIEDDSGSNVTFSVYFDPSILPSGLYNPDPGVTVQWAAAYPDPATGMQLTNYLYLYDDYLLGASTNVVVANNGFPNNFTFYESTVPLDLGLAPASPGFYSVFIPGSVTNRYAYGSATMLASVPTNNLPNQSVTNLPGRVQISADSYLNLSNVEITGQNYTSLYCTNEFAGSGGALIQAPYADLNLGTTNGVLYLTNTIAATVPFFGGTIQAWTTRFWTADTNTADFLPGTNDFRILIVGTHLTPIIASEVQDMILHDYASHAVVISDTFNVIRTFQADVQSMTVTTNLVGVGSTSFQGELNLLSQNIFWRSSVPNLRYLTNDGAIRMQNLAYYAAPVLTNTIPAAPATGTLTGTGTNAVKKDKVTIGNVQYLFVSTLTNKVANQVAIVPSSFDATLSNLIAAINAGPGAGTAYSTNTKANPQATAGPLSNHAFLVTAVTNGTPGNSVVTTFTPFSSRVNLSWGSHATLFGGHGQTNTLVPYIGNSALINNGIFEDQGTIAYADNFESSDVFSNGIGSFSLQSITTTLTNGAFYAAGDVSITAASMLSSNVFLQAARSLTLQITNQLSDTGPSPTNLSSWAVGSASVGSGFNLPIKPALGDLLGTTITLSAPASRNVVSVWAGQDRGISPAGYTNNVAIGQLILDASPSSVDGHNGLMTFNGAGSNNALYVDCLILTNAATQGNATNQYNFPWLSIGNNMMIYFAQALLPDGTSVAENIDRQSKAGANGGRLRWVYSYAGYYSSTNSVYTNQFGLPVTNAVNAALAQSSTIDSDSDGRPNNVDATPFFVPSELNLAVTFTNRPPPSVKIQWTTIPNATNSVFYATNAMATNWLPFTNFTRWYYGNSVGVSNSLHANFFRSPQAYVNNASLPDNSQQTNVWVYDTITNVPHYYKVVVWPWLNFPE